MSVDQAGQPLQNGPLQDDQRTQQPAADAAPTAPPASFNPAPQDDGAIANQAHAAAAAQSQKPDHGDVFKHILGVFAGGARRPVIDENGNPVTDPNTGKVKTQPMTVKNLGAGILSGALASMMAGFESPDKYDQYGHRDLSGAAQAGAAAGQANSSEGRVAKIQGMADEDRLRAYTTMKQNMDLHASALAVDKLGEEAIDRNVENFAPLRASIPEGLKLPDGTPFIVEGGEDVGEADMQKLMASGNGPTTHSAMPTGKRFNPETGKIEQTWTVFNNAGKIPITAENAAAYGFDKASVGQDVPISVFMKHAQIKAVRSTVEGIVEDTNSQMGLTGKKAPTLESIIKEAGPSYNDPKKMAEIQSVAGMDPGQAVDQLRKNGDQNLAAVWAHQFKINEVTWADQREEAKRKAQQANDPDKQPVSEQQIAELPVTLRKMYPNLDPGRIDAAISTLRDPKTNKVGANQGNLKKAMDMVEKMDESQRNYELKAQEQQDKENKDAGAENYFETPDALGHLPNKNLLGNFKNAQSVAKGFKKQADETTKMDGTYQQFQSILNDVKAGKSLNGAQSVVALFNAIGISATPLAGKGFRINNNTVEEHAGAIDMPDKLVRYAVSTFKNGEVISGQQVADYAKIAMETRVNQYVNIVNQATSAGVNVDPLLPRGNGQNIDANTAEIFARLSGWDGKTPWAQVPQAVKDKAKAAATAKGWN